MKRFAIFGFMDLGIQWRKEKYLQHTLRGRFRRRSIIQSDRTASLAVKRLLKQSIVTVGETF